MANGIPRHDLDYSDHANFYEACRPDVPEAGAKQGPAVYGAINIDPWGEKRIGDWIQTRTGRKFHLLDTRPEDFDIRDIAHALSNVCRFTGHVSTFYSVGEHSVRVADLIAEWTCSKEVQYAGLMHDATEAYIADVSRPFKQLPEFKWYRDIEDRLMASLAPAMGVVYPLPWMVKTADEILLGSEARDLMSPVVDGWHFRYSHIDHEIRPWSPKKAKRKFLHAYYRLNPFGHTNKHQLRLFGFAR